MTRRPQVFDQGSVVCHLSLSMDGRPVKEGSNGGRAEDSWSI